MTSARQIAANRRNAQRSTGPRTKVGKDRSRRNALRHGLTSETVIASLEDRTEYKEFEAALFETFNPVTIVECELTARLASLLWRLRRAASIETGLFSIQAQIQREKQVERKLHNGIGLSVQRILKAAIKSAAPTTRSHNDPIHQPVSLPESGVPLDTPNTQSHGSFKHLSTARCFLRLANLNGDAIDRVGRYEARLWKQAAQLLLLLQFPRS